MSNSVRPHRWQPTRLHCPWDSPGKNTGVGCHFLLQCMKVKSESEVAQSCPTLRGPMDCSLPGSSLHGIFQARVLEWGAIVFSDLLPRVIAKIKQGNASQGFRTVPGREPVLRKGWLFLLLPGDCSSLHFPLPPSQLGCPSTKDSCLKPVLPHSP